jgi:hypothetical protein
MSISLALWARCSEGVRYVMGLTVVNTVTKGSHGWLVIWHQKKNLKMVKNMKTLKFLRSLHVFREM